MVIGAAGFIGARLAAALEVAGVPTVRCTTSRPFIRNGVLIPEVRAASVIFYLASSVNQVIADRWPDRATADGQVFASLLLGLRMSGSHPVVMLASSGGCVYDPALPPPYHEGMATRPTSVYGSAKLRMEQLLVENADAVRPVVLRLANVYGPGQKTGTGQGVIAYWLTALAAGQPLDLIGDGQTRRDYIYIDDAVDAMLRVYAAGTAREAWSRRQPTIVNIGSGVPVSLRQLLRHVASVAGLQADVRQLRARGFDRRDVWLDVRRAAAELGWRPRTALVDGLALTWQAFLSQRTLSLL